MTAYGTVAGMVILIFLAPGCGKEKVSTAVPAPAELSGEEIGYYCNMTLTAHPGPKGQIFLTDREEPLWFASARDSLAFIMLPEEAKNISAVYVSDMGRASWNQPEPGTWVEARKAWYVVGSGRVGGMGAPESVPFAEKTRAEEFQARYGGRVLGFDDIPEEEILGFDDPTLEHSRHRNVGRTM